MPTQSDCERSPIFLTLGDNLHAMDINSVAVRALGDAEVYLETIDPEAYARPLDLLSGASIGQHTRHLVEFYQCLVDQADSESINYSKRLRDPMIEQDPKFALEVIRRLSVQVNSMDPETPISLQCSEHFDGENVEVTSNLGRELLYNIEHTIHHLAIIKIGLAAVAPEFDLPEHFGVAPSTIQHRNSCAQ